MNKVGDCERCYGEWPLTMCRPCESWLCPHCHKTHNHKAWREMKTSINRSVAKIFGNDPSPHDMD